MHGGSGVAFSGGIDSSLIASVAASMNQEIKLYTTGMCGSHDIKQAEKAATLLGLRDRLHLCECTQADIESAILPVMRAIGSTNPVAVGIGLCMYFVSGCARTYGASVLLTGQGADELFAGYKRYEQTLDDGRLDRELERDMLALPDQVERDAAVARLNGVELLMPMLHSGVTDLARKIDVRLKIRREDGYTRKYILRRASEEYLSAELAQAPKKAAQYGTGIQNVLRRMARREGVTQGEFLRRIARL
jgi:asparagine synthase (glutamine-hydrolysing)